MRHRFEIVPRRPYSLERTGDRLARFREVVDRFEAGAYRRLLFVDGAPLLLEARQHGPPSRAVIRVTLSGECARRKAARERALDVLERVLGIGIDVRPFYRRFSGHALLGPLLRSHRGLRVAGRADLWHAMVQIVLSQQIHLKLAHDMLSDLVETFGRSATFDGERFHDFPTPRRIARVPLERLRQMRLSRAKATTLVGLARAFESGELSESRLAALGDDEAVDYLVGFKGVGRWTAEFTLLRGASRMDVFPGGDLGVVKYLAMRLLGRDAPAREEEMRRIASEWRPFRGLALIYAYAEPG